MAARGYSKSRYLHTKVDNEGAQALFTRGGHEEPADAKAGLTQMQIAQRGDQGGRSPAGSGSVGGWAPHSSQVGELNAKDYA